MGIHELADMAYPHLLPARSKESSIEPHQNPRWRRIKNLNPKLKHRLFICILKKSRSQMLVSRDEGERVPYIGLEIQHAPLDLKILPIRSIS